MLRTEMLVAVAALSALAFADCRETPSAANELLDERRALAPLEVDVLAYDEGSILYVDDGGRRWRLPYGKEGFRGIGGRICHEVCRGRDHFNAGGIHYELPAGNVHGFAGVRPVATHAAPLCDGGLFIGTLPGALKVMAIDGMWNVGKAVGRGGPWCETAVKAGEPSDPYLMNGFDRKSLTLCSDAPCTVTLEIDIDGWGTWVKADSFKLAAGTCYRKAFPRDFGGYWARLTSDADATVSATFDYE